MRAIEGSRIRSSGNIPVCGTGRESRNSVIQIAGTMTVCAAGLTAQGNYTHIWRSVGHFANHPLGIHWTAFLLKDKRGM